MKREYKKKNSKKKLPRMLQLKRNNAKNVEVNKLAHVQVARLCITVQKSVKETIGKITKPSASRNRKKRKRRKDLKKRKNKRISIGLGKSKMLVKGISVLS